MKRFGRDGIAWLMGGLLGALSLGQSLRPGSILHLDFVLLPHAPVPAGVWGLGTELPRRTPLLLPLAWLDPLLGSTLVGKLLVVVCVAAMFVGAGRLVPQPCGWSRHIAGLLYAASPFTMTRLAVGHLFVLAAMAVLPWVVVTLLDPLRDSRRLFRSALAMGLTGSFGGLLVGLFVVAGLVGRPEPLSRKLRALGIAVVAQLPWLLPGLVVYAQGTRIAGSGAFPTDLGGVGGPLRLLVGHGFWQRGFQVGGASGVLVPVLGLVLLALALIGQRRLHGDVRRLGPVAAFVLLLTFCSGFAPMEGVYSWLVSLPGGLAVREGQRILVPFVLWLAVSVAAGAAGSLREAVGRAELPRVAAVVAAALLVAPGVWGAGGQLQSVDLPSGWEEARRHRAGQRRAGPRAPMVRVRRARGGRRSNRPEPSPDLARWGRPHLVGPEVARGGGERAARPVEALAGDLVAKNLRGESIGTDLAELGVRWVVVLRDGDVLRGRPVGEIHAEALREDPTAAQRAPHVRDRGVRGLGVAWTDRPRFGDARRRRSRGDPVRAGGPVRAGDLVPAGGAGLDAWVAGRGDECRGLDRAAGGGIRPLVLAQRRRGRRLRPGGRSDGPVVPPPAGSLTKGMG